MVTTHQLFPHVRAPHQIRGSAFIEFVVVAPLILFIAGYAFRFAQQLQAQQIGLVFARELATAAFLQCADYTIQVNDLCVDTTTTTSAIQNCLNQVQISFTNSWNTARPPTYVANSLAIRMAVYRYNLASFNIAPPSQCATPSGTVSTITPSGGAPPPTPPPTTSICSQNRIARAVISFQIQPSGSFLPGISTNTINITHEITL